MLFSKNLIIAWRGEKKISHDLSIKALKPIHYCSGKRSPLLCFCTCMASCHLSVPPPSGYVLFVLHAWSSNRQKCIRILWPKVVLTCFNTIITDGKQLEKFSNAAFWPERLTCFACGYKFNSEFYFKWGKMLEISVLRAAM